MFNDRCDSSMLDIPLFIFNYVFLSIFNCYDALFYFAISYARCPLKFLLNVFLIDYVSIVYVYFLLLFLCVVPV